jgi:hypothetical protein
MSNEEVIGVLRYLHTWARKQWMADHERKLTAIDIAIAALKNQEEQQNKIAYLEAQLKRWKPSTEYQPTGVAISDNNRKNKDQ